MYLNQNHSIISDITIRRQVVACKCSYYRCEVQLEFKEDSQHFLEAVPLQTNSYFQPILKDYAIKIQQNNRIIFEKLRDGGSYQHGEILKKIERFFDKFDVLVINQPFNCEKSLTQLRERILSLDERIGASMCHQNSSKTTKTLIIYCPKVCSRIVDVKINEYLLAKRERLVYSLNHLMGKGITQYNIRQFILKFLEFYSTQLKQICASKLNNRKRVQLTVVNLNPTRIQPEERNLSWLKSQFKGFYGLQFDVYGQEYQFIKFYSLVQDFFRNFKFLVKNLTQIGIQQKEISNRIRASNLKAVVLKEVLIVFEPPSNLDLILKQLNRKKWTLVPKDFLNLQFQLIYQYKRQFLQKLRLKNGLNFVGMSIQDNLIEFQTDEQGFKCIKQISRQFLIEMKGESKRINFLCTSEDVQIIKKYYMGNNSNFYLSWQSNQAVLRCPKRDMDDNYNKLQEHYKDFMKNRVNIMSKHSLRHPIVKCIKKNAEFSYFPSCRYKYQDVILTIRHIDEVFQQERALFIVNAHDTNQELFSILKRNCSCNKSYKELEMKEIETLNQLNLQSIYIIKMSSSQNIVVKPEKINKILEVFISRILPINVVLPKYSPKAYQSVLKLLTDHIAYRRSAMKRKDVCVFLPFVKDTYDIPQEVLANISQTLFYSGFYKINDYILSQRQILDAGVGLVSMKCKIKGLNHECTSLNSFIFKYELESNKQNSFKIGIFVPKKQVKQYLVCLSTQQVFQVQNFKVKQAEVHNNIFKTTIQIIKKQCPMQTYAVLYCGLDKKSFPASIYVYNSDTADFTLQKWKLDIERKQIKDRKGEATFEVNCERKECFLLQTHQSFKTELLELIQKEDRKQ